jgi:hypothetical protein
MPQRFATSTDQPTHPNLPLRAACHQLLAGAFRRCQADRAAAP